MCYVPLPRPALPGTAMATPAEKPEPAGFVEVAQVVRDLLLLSRVWAGKHPAVVFAVEPGMIRSASRAFLVALTLAALVAGCGNPTAPSVTTTTTTTTTSSSTTATVAKTETYPGTITTGVRNTYHFPATPGTITLTMTALDPNVLLPAVGMGLGTYDLATNTCTLVVSTTAAQAGIILTGTATVSYEFCVQVWDASGFAPGYTATYTVTAVHQALAGA